MARVCGPIIVELSVRLRRLNDVLLLFEIADR